MLRHGRHSDIGTKPRYVGAAGVMILFLAAVSTPVPGDPLSNGASTIGADAGDSGDSGGFRLTEAEREWLSSHPAIGIMSHELRTPLNSIIGFTGILLQNLAGPLNAEQTKQPTIVKNAGQYLLDLINDVPDISKIEAGQLRLHSDSFDIVALIEKCVKPLRPIAEKKGLALEVVSEAPCIEGWSDRRRVEQIVINLVNNALKFTKEGDVTVRCAPTNGRVTVSVEDTGIGIKPEDVSKLFKAFSQIGTGTSRQHEGTGLGVSISRKLMGMLGGEIRVKSEWGLGSTFTFSLPFEEEDPNGQNPRY